MYDLNFRPLRAAALGLTASIGLAGAAAATTVSITITNNQDVGGLHLTPLLAMFHDGSFDAFDAGSASSSAVQLLAEEGSPADVIAEIDAARGLYPPHPTVGTASEQETGSGRGKARHI